MIGLELLEITIGVVLIYLLLSLLCSAVAELLEAFLKRRARDLERGLAQMFADVNGLGAQGLVRRLYEHPLIHALYPGPYPAPAAGGPLGRLVAWLRRARLPSYIPSRLFALALVDLLRAEGSKNGPPDDGSGSAAETRALVAKLANPTLRDALLSLLDDASADLNRARKRLEFWYDSVMERVAGWYKRWTQALLLILGLALAILVNVDTVALIQHLSRDAAVRQTLVDLASTSAAAGQADSAALLEEIRRLGLPLGWDATIAGSVPADATGWALKALGWLLTACAISLGAPFWFDLLNRIINVRATVKPEPEAVVPAPQPQPPRSGQGRLPEEEPATVALARQ